MTYFRRQGSHPNVGVERALYLESASPTVLVLDIHINTSVLTNGKPNILVNYSRSRRRKNVCFNVHTNVCYNVSLIVL